jgi:hypothetical protein
MRTVEFAMSEICPVRVVGGWLNQLLITVWPLMIRRLPSSLLSANVYVPVVGGVSVPVHLADQLVAGTPDAGEAPPQMKFTTGSARVSSGVPDMLVPL